jgi:anthranilate synthase component 2/putative glutamine amidotransferase
MQPLIGITTYTERTSFGVWNTDAAVLPKSYVDSVVRSGGVPVLLPPTSSGLSHLIERLDGLILSGGADVVPFRYGQPNHPQTTGTRPDRDSFEFRLARAALAVGLPMLGVCRGMQVLNVLLHGSLIQHLPERVNHEGHRPALGTYGSSEITIHAGSRLAGLLGERASVHCHHHQAIDRLADGLVAVGHAEDGTIEAIEVPGADFVLGVQWHPEESPQDDRLFSALTRAASARQGQAVLAR